MKSVFLKLLIVWITILCITDKSLSQDDEIYLIIRGDDMGFTQAANEACIQAYLEGILTTAEVIVPGPYFMEAATLLNNNPGIDAGVHLTLTSEWVNHKWGPVTSAPSLVDSNNYFPPGNTEFLALNPPLTEIEAELREQIELAIEYIPHVSHLSYHMGTAVANDDLINIAYSLSVEYNLVMMPDGDVRSLGMWNQPADNKMNYLRNILLSLSPGINLFVCHPAYDNEETQAIEGEGEDANVHMAEHREVVTQALCNEEIMQIIEDRGIHLVDYMDTYDIDGTTYLSDGNSAYNIRSYQNRETKETIIDYNIPEPGFITIDIYDLSGKKVTNMINEYCHSGSYQTSLVKNNLQKGVYVIKLKNNNTVLSKKIFVF